MRKSFLAAILITFFSMAYAENWPSWRGPGSLGISDQKPIPVKWDMAKNVKWKAEVPGLGHSSPIVWGNRVFVTTAVSDEDMRRRAAALGHQIRAEDGVRRAIQIITGCEV